MQPKILSLMLLSCFALFPLQNAYAINLFIVNNNNNAPVAGPLRLISSNPYDRQKLDTPPTSITMTFSQPIKPDKSFIRLYNLNGDQLEVGELESQGMNMTVSLTDITEGKYTIKWRAHCQCNDNTEISDSFHFTVQ